MACCEVVGGDIELALDAACALEMVHCFSLIHDDLPALDNDDLRRGIATCHVKFGEAVAVLAGDAMFALAFQTMASVPAACSARCTSLLAKASGSLGLAGGEVVDLLSEGAPVTPENLIFIHEHKTASLISASCEIGAMLGGASAAQLKALASYGQKVGLGFQIADDLLNELSTAEELGKATGSDRARMKATFPALHGVDASRVAAKSTIDSSLKELDLCGGDTSFLREIALYAIDRLH